MTGDSLKRRILRDLREQGFEINKGMIYYNQNISKKQIRSLHSKAKQEKLEENQQFISKNKDTLIEHFAEGKEVEPANFSPVIYQVGSGTLFSNLFRFTTLMWSVPVSHGYGRRMRFLVFDESTDKLVGLFALGDPVFNIRVRDQWIGWDQNQRKQRLYNVMDMFVLGAVPPYNRLLCGKFIALVATSDIVRKSIWGKYKNSRPIIMKKKKKPHLVLLTTISALGRSSLYNRLKTENGIRFKRLGFTEGWGHFHLNNGTFLEMKEYLEQIGHPVLKSYKYGAGPNWRIRVARTCLEEIGLSNDLLKHGIKREFYAIPLAKNFREYLLGKDCQPEYYDVKFDNLVDFFKERWMIPRSKRYPDYKRLGKKTVLSYIFGDD